MNKKTIIPDAAKAVLEESPGPAVVLDGNPSTAEKIVAVDGGVEVGIWQVEPGVFESKKQGTSEFMHFIFGEGFIESADGEKFVIEPGAVLYVPSGWSGTWHVVAPTRKTYTIIPEVETK